MLYPKIMIRDKHTGCIFQFGKSYHDQLIVIDGHLEYLNLQNLCGTPDVYEFVPIEDEMGIADPHVELEYFCQDGEITIEEVEEINNKYQFFSMISWQGMTKEEYEEIVKKFVCIRKDK